MASLPLMCKGCGQRLVIPERSTLPDPPPVLPVAPPPPVAKPRPVKPPPAPLPEDDEGVLVAGADDTPDIDFDISGPLAVTESDAHRRRLPESVPPVPASLTKSPAPIPKPAAHSRPPLLGKVLPFMADVAIGAVLLVVGGFLGEIVAGKPTGQVWNEAGGAVAFPPMDLLMWVSPVVMLVLIEALLLSRGVSVSGWWKRRNGGYTSRSRN